MQNIKRNLETTAMVKSQVIRDGKPLRNGEVNTTVSRFL